MKVMETAPLMVYKML